MDNHELPYIVLLLPFIVGYAIGAFSALLVAGLWRILHKENGYDRE